MAWMRPSSPAPPCKARNTNSTSLMLNAVGDSAMARPRTFAICAFDGGSGATPVASRRRSAAESNRPVAVSTADTSWPRRRNAGMICAALAIETSRSSLVPPNSTAIFTMTSPRPRATRFSSRHRDYAGFLVRSGSTKAAVGDGRQGVDADVCLKLDREWRCRPISDI